MILRKLAELKFPKKKGIRKTKYYDQKEKCWVLTIENDKKNSYHVYMITIEEEVKLYNFFDSKIAGFQVDEEFALQSTKRRVRELIERCEVGWKECPMELFQKVQLQQLGDTTMSQN